MYVPADVEPEAAMGQITQGGALLLVRWLDWQQRFVQPKVLEFEVTEEVLQELRDERDLSGVLSVLIYAPVLTNSPQQSECCL